MSASVSRNAPGAPDANANADVDADADAAGACDLAVIGGGVNGCAVARDAAGRGASVLLCEADDLASATSSASSKLIHGGLRYLERRQFRLVREALREREILLRSAPHLIRPLRFALPCGPNTRPAWLLRAGLALYDLLAGRGPLPAARRGAPPPELRPGFSAVFEYSDCRADDARLTILLARDAARRGARILTRARAVRAVRAADAWTLHLQTPAGPRRLRARVLVNAAGPWAGEVAAALAVPLPRPRLVRGAHLVLPKFFAGDRAFLMQGEDRRIVFAIPFEDDFALLGTTDVDHCDGLEDLKCSAAEEEYLLNAARRFFREVPARVVWRFAGVRALFDDDPDAPAQDASRDYRLPVDAPPGGAPLLHVCGGKLTTHRKLAERVLAKLRPWLPHLGPAWTAAAVLPGGDFPPDGAAALEKRLRETFPILNEAAARRLIGAYGTAAAQIFPARPADWGEHFGAGLYGCEVAHMMREEWAQTAEDVLWRRSKLGLRLNAAQAARLREWMRARTADRDSISV